MELQTKHAYVTVDTEFEQGHGCFVSSNDPPPVGEVP